MKLKKVVFVLFLLAIACSKDDDAVISSELSDYVERFVAEGKTRSTTVDIHDLSVTFAGEAELPGHCGEWVKDLARIQIKKSDNCWNKRSDMDREILLFHELGHALLGRPHNNDTLPNGDFKSMMFEGTQFNIYNAHTPERRQYYLDELFNASVPAPDWSKVKTQRVEILNDTITASTDWLFDNTSEQEDKGTVSSAFSFSKSHSLSIASERTTSNGFSNWSYLIRNPQLPVGSKLILK